MILFSSIYNKAINLFDDPKITYAYETNKIAFYKYMYGYLQTVSMYEPVIISQALSDITSPDGKMEIFDADGVNNTFSLTLDIPVDSEIICNENGEQVNAIIDLDSHTITFPHTLNVGETYTIEYYFPGCYNTNFTGITSSSATQQDIIIKVTNILARLLVIAWAEETRNMLVDIQNLLRDSDFKATPNNQILNAKVNWIQELQYDNRRDQNKLSWYLRYSSGVAKFKRF